MPMAPVSQKPAPLPTPQPVAVTIETPGYKHHLIDARINELSTLITYMSGMNWTVDVYGQVLTENEQPSPWQPNQMGPYKQYEAIRSMELKLQGTMTPSFNNEQGTMSMSGSAHVHPLWKPHVYDTIIASIGDGRLGQFTVTRVNPLSIYKDAAHEIEFELSRVADQTVVTALDKLVIKESFFRSDFLAYGQNPVLVQETVDLVERIEKTEERLRRSWLSSFFSNEFSTLVIPGQVNAVYDPFMVRAALDVFDSNEAPQIRRIKQLNMGGIQAFDTPTVLDALVRLDESYLPNGAWMFGLVGRGVFSQAPAVNSFFFSGITYACYPKLPLTHVDSEYGALNPAYSDQLLALEDVQEDLSSVMPDNVSGDEDVPTNALPAFHAILRDDGYIFSHEFYNQAATGQSVLEAIVRDVLRGEAVNTNNLFAVIEQRVHFGRLEHFYYDFVLVLLLRIALRQV